MNSSKIVGSVYSSDNFEYSSNSKTFSANISKVLHVLSYLWDDGLDVGFGIQSINTGRIVYFTCTKIDTEDDGDIIGWHFTVFNPDNEAIIKGIKVHISNDII